MRPTSKPESGDHSFAARLRRYRLAHNYTIKQASERHKINHHTWAGWESRGRMPGDVMLGRKILRILERFERSKEGES